MRLTKKILEKLLSDNIFRLKTAIALNVGERHVVNMAKNNHDNLTKASAIEVYKSYGFTEDEIFEKEEAEN